MKKGSSNLDFHQTFKPERSCLNALLIASQECSGKTIQEISKITGIPTGASSGKVVPTIYYLQYMGLIREQNINKRYELEMTNLGECVLMEDPGLIEDLTLLLLHGMMVRNNRGAELWHYIICEIIPKYHGTINKQYLDKELELKYGKEINMAPFNGTYSGLFEPLGLLTISGGDYSFREHSINPEFIYLYGLLLYEDWDDWAESFTETERQMMKVSTNELTADQLAETGFRNTFGWSDQNEYRCLEMLHDKGVISLNRQMSPFTVRRLYSRDELIDALYSELC